MGSSSNPKKELSDLERTIVNLIEWTDHDTIVELLQKTPKTEQLSVLNTFLNVLRRYPFRHPKKYHWYGPITTGDSRYDYEGPAYYIDYQQRWESIIYTKKKR